MRYPKRTTATATLAGAIAVAGLAVFVTTGAGDPGGGIGAGAGYPAPVLIDAAATEEAAAAGPVTAAKRRARRRGTLRVTYRIARDPIPVPPNGVVSAGIRCKRKEVAIGGGQENDAPGLADIYSAPTNPNPAGQTKRRTWYGAVLNLTDPEQGGFEIGWKPLAVCAR